MDAQTHLFNGVRPCFVVLCNNGLTFCDRIIDCLGFVPGGAWYVPRNAGPERDIRMLGAGFFTVDGIGICERALPYGSGAGCIVERLRSAIIRIVERDGEYDEHNDEHNQQTRPQPRTRSHVICMTPNPHPWPPENCLEVLLLLFCPAICKI